MWFDIPSMAYLQSLQSIKDTDFGSYSSISKSILGRKSLRICKNCNVPLLFAKPCDTFDVVKFFFSTLQKLLMMSPPTWSPNLLEVIAKLFIWLRKYFCQIANSPTLLSVPCGKATPYHEDRLRYYFYHFISRSEGTWIL